MKHIKFFENITQYESYKNGSDFVLPNVSYVEELKGISFNPNVEPSSPNLVCVYDITNTSGKIQIMASYGGYAYTAMIVDGVEMDFDCYYQFDTEGLHTVEFIFDEEYKTELPSQGFDYVTQLVSITIPDSVTSISAPSIAATANLKEFKGKYASKDCKCLIVDGELILSARGGLKELTEYIIPNGVTTIGYDVFRGCNSLESITIPDSVISIGGSAFSNCSSLTSITIPNNVTKIGSYAFRECTNLISAIIGNSVETIEQDAFWNCSNLTSIVIPDSVTSIGRNAFSDCYSITSVTIGNGVTSIGYNAFYNCRNLQEFNGKFASEDNKCLIIDGKLIGFAPVGLTSYIIPDGVTEIDAYVFSNLTLTSITIPDSVTSIGNYAFWGCDNLTSVYCKATIPPRLQYNAFPNKASNLKFYVPAENIQSYKLSSQWSSYYNNGVVIGYNF